MVGALLVAAAAVATFAAYLDATAAPTTRVVVATAAVEPGTRLSSLTEVSARFGTIAFEPPAEVAVRLVTASEVEDLVGQVVIAPLEPGDLVTRSHLVEDGGVPAAQTLSFSLPRNAAVAGTVRPGERIDVLATYGTGDGAYTAYVVRGVPVLQVTAPDGGTVGAAPEVTLTVAVSALTDVQALGHAVNTASVFVTRSTARPGDDARAPGAFRAAPETTGPAPDPAAIVGQGPRAGGDDTPQDGGR